MTPREIVLTAVAAAVLLGGGTVGGCYGCPQYRVYEQRLAGEAKLREAESSRQIQIEDAKGKEQAAKLLAQAEVERAKGVAEANRIIGDSLKNNPEYLTFKWIEQVNADGNSVIYIPTEAGIPILEANRSMLTHARERERRQAEAEAAKKDKK